MTVIILNSIAYLTLLFIYFLKKRELDLGFFIILTFLISSIGSCWYYTFDVAANSYTNISFVAFIYLFISYFICVFPILKFNTNNIRSIRETGSLNSFLTIISIVFSLAGIIPCFELLMYLSPNALGGSVLGMMYEKEIDMSSVFFSGVGKFFFAIIRRFPDIIIVLLLYNFSRSKKKIFLLIGLSISILAIILYNILSGSRGGVLFDFVGLFCGILIFRPFLDKKLFKKIVKYSSIVVIGVFLAIALITVSRFSYSVSNASSDSTLDRWISQYIGEGMIRFNHTIWNLKKTAEGDQNFSYFKDLIGLDTITDYDLLIRKYHAILGAPVDVFYTFIGDFVIDFGLFGGLLLCVFIYFTLKRLTRIKDGRIEIWQIVLLLQFCHLFFFGFAANVYRSYFIQQNLLYSWIVLIVIYLIPRLSSSTNLKIKK